MLWIDAELLACVSCAFLSRRERARAAPGACGSGRLPSHVHHGIWQKSRDASPRTRGCGRRRGLRGPGLPPKLELSAGECPPAPGTLVSKLPKRRADQAAVPEGLQPRAPSDGAPPCSPATWSRRLPTPAPAESKLRRPDPPRRKAACGSGPSPLVAGSPLPPYTPPFSCVLKICHYEEF